MGAAKPSPKDLIARYLVCPTCRAGNLETSAGGYRCVACGRCGEIRDGVFLTRPLETSHYFDDLHSVMQQGNEDPAIWTMCYAQQSGLATALIKRGDVVLDIGCGPVVHFARREDCVLVGVDPSFESIRANRSIDLAVFGSAEALPFSDRSVDRIFFFYSIHHMIGNVVEENVANLTAAFHEARRVVRESGDLVIFDMSPWWLAWQAQLLAWNHARRLLAEKLDMFFWHKRALSRLAHDAFAELSFEAKSFSVSPFLVFPPVFSLPRLKVPRFLYPFDIMMYKWSF